MSGTQVSPAAGSAVRICCDNMEGYDWEGKIYTRYRKEPMYFRNAAELMGLLEEFYNWIEYPQASTIDRSFQETESKNQDPGRGTGRRERRVVVVSMEEMERTKGEKATFVVRIQYRQNATWQGQVTWAEKNKTINFRSALELLKLIDSTAEGGIKESWDG